MNSADYTLEVDLLNAATTDEEREEVMPRLASLKANQLGLDLDDPELREIARDAVARVQPVAKLRDPAELERIYRDSQSVAEWRRLAVPGFRPPDSGQPRSDSRPRSDS